MTVICNIKANFSLAEFAVFPSYFSLVRTATVAALGCLIRDCKIKEVHDKAYMQLETYLADQNVLENHSLIRQLIVTMGNIVLNCKTSFKDEGKLVPCKN